ncbi:hypothetical protein ACFP2T_03185 [Plantactinospora solaniradicis]|uniref:Uncharacterized protein n=1 Tax=Plantactinospora solaniradicis TaxID=1723736 RepID=A0ABW1K0H6_9ACTN
MDGSDMIPLVAIGLVRTTDREVHGDLLLRLGTYRHTCDSYYLAIDDSPAAGATIEEDLARLLDQWVQQLRQLTPAGVVFLPFDFSDQCTAWLRVECPDVDRAVVQAGWSSLEGYSIMPSTFTEAATPEDFAPITNATIACRLSDLITTLEHSRDAVRHGD